MYLALIVAMLVAIGAAYVFRQSRRRPLWFAAQVSGCFGLGIIGGMVAAVVVGVTYQPVQFEERSEIVSLHTESGISGVFVLGSGSVHPADQYRVLVKNSDGSLSPYTVDSYHHVRIIEDKTKTDTGELITEFETADGQWELGYPRIKSYLLVVPPASVVESFKVQ